MANVNINGTLEIKGDNIFEKIYPISSIFLSLDSVSPASQFGGVWELLPENYTLWTASSGAGQIINAGLPNITGNVSSIWSCRTFDNAPTYSGGLQLDGRVTNGSASGGGWQMYLHGLNLNASKSNSIYGKSTTVQPPAIKIYAWKRVG